MKADLRGTPVNTTDATETTALSFATRDDHAYHVSGTVVAARTDTFAQGASYRVHGTFLNDGGTLALVGAVTADHSGESDANWAATLDASGETIRVRVTGAAGVPITWLAALDVTEVGKYVANYGMTD